MKVRLSALMVILGLAWLLTGCGSGGSGGSSSGQALSAAAPAVGPPAAGPAGGAAAVGAAVVGASAVAPRDAAADSAMSSEVVPSTPGTRLIRTAQMTLRVPDLTTAGVRVRATAVAFGGDVSAETTTFTHPQSVITLRVLEPKMDDALTRLATYGKVLDRTTTSEDVTAPLADLTSRVNNQSASVDRIRLLMARATTLKDVVLIESELSTREADLEALQARDRVLADEADLATITVTLLTSPPAAAKVVHHHLGFLSGLRHGWHALSVATRVVLAALGAALPFAVVLLVIGAVGYLGSRRFRRFRRSPADPLTSAATKTD